ncbi:MAG: RyR domain-containing protein [Terriglobia bacterium]
MASPDGSRNVVIVTGDVTMDWNLARTRRTGAGRLAWTGEDCTRAHFQRGGAALLADLIGELADELRQHGQANYDVRQTAAPQDSVSPDDERFNHSCAVWSPFPYSVKASSAKGSDKGAEKDPEEKKVAWRVEEFLGLDRSAPDAPQKGAEWKRVVNDCAEADLVVLDDADLGFREHPELWPQALTAGRRPWILLKMARPVAQGALWEHLQRNYAERLIVVMTINDLRLTEVQISRELSWERTAQDLAWEITYNRDLRGLARSAYVVVSFNAAGAFLYSPAPADLPAEDGDRDSPCRLLFDPEVVEGMWEQGYPGRMVGYTSCLTAGIARQLMLSPEKPDIRTGIRTGLSALRCLHREGYGQYGQAGASSAQVNLEFPIRTVLAALAPDDTRDTQYHETAVPMRTGSTYWTILGGCHPSNLEEVAAKVVLNGPEQELKGVPLGRFGELLTVDRQEIESLRSIRCLVSEYVAQVHPKRPLSIAVFGPPGSGKSFGIKQLALALRPGEIEPKEFNLSQLESTDELLSAFHQVRDIGLGGKIPLVFWDEFDCDHQGAYGWLRHFLMPMQDGKFLQGHVEHPIGKAIFVFAGGTSEKLEDFAKNLGEDQKRAAKVPDFVSRLKGYINILGPNPREGGDDPYYVLRRAILLRSMLSREAKHILRQGVVQIDSGVLRAMLLTRTYKHGARSMESVIAMSQLAGKTRFERSSLPTEAQLDLHVDGQDFLARVQQLELEGEILERMARAAHAVYCAEQKDLGWKYGPRRNEATKENPSLVDFDLLPEDDKDQNRSQVRDIPAKLAHAGCIMVPARSGEPPFTFPDDVLEELASMEHTRWMREKIGDGWRYSPATDRAGKLHQCLLPWRKGDLTPYAGFAEQLGAEELPEEEKEKDRTAVRKMATILAQAGYTIVEARSKGARAQKV